MVSFDLQKKQRSANYIPITTKLKGKAKMVA
jgi:hypothetical protein